MRIIDITQPLGPDVAVWPGDQSFQPRWSARITEGSSVNVGAVTMSLHTGTHADAPLHYDDEGISIDTISLEVFVGPCIVVNAFGEGAIGPDVLTGEDLSGYPRILFRTDSFLDNRKWSDAFRYLSVDTVEYAARHGVRLMGMDTPSVDPADSKQLPAHHALRRYKIANLENLKLAHVEPGRYELVALPVAIQGMDAGPVRAALIVRE